MSLPTAPTSTPARVQTVAPPLGGPWLVLARGGWATLAALLVAFFLANLPVYFTQLRTVCLHSPCARWQLTPATAQTLRQFHLSPTEYAVTSVAFSMACASVWFAVALVIVWRQSRQWLALLSSVLLIDQCIIQLNGSLATPLEYSTSLWHTATLFVGALGLVLYLLIFSLFPTGRFIPGWMRWSVVLLALAICWVYVSIVPWSTASNAEFVPNPLVVGVGSAVLGSIMAAQIYRYRRVSTPVERQQTKWVVLGVIEGPLVGIPYFLLPLFFPALNRPGSLYFLLAKPAYNILWLFVPVCFGIAILRYHLWEIDVLIRRTLVYGTLSAILAVLYFGVVVGLQALVGSVNSTAASSPVIVVGTTLLIAALFNPLRHRIQAFIDQRFYRHKYDAAKTLAAFSATLRSEVELAQVREQLLAVVAATMQPAHASLWLRAPPPQRGTPDAQPPTGAPRGSRGPLGNVRAV
jgi:hypothetical protein